MMACSISGFILVINKDVYPLVDVTKLLILAHDDLIIMMGPIYYS